MRKIFDFIIVGSGPCGLLSAYLLSQKGSVLVIEEGLDIKEKEKDIYSYQNIIKGYQNQGINVALGSIPVLLSEGSCLGGGSSVNSSLHHRAPNYVWEEWRKIFDIHNFSQDKVINAYEVIEKLFNAELGNIKPSIFYEKAAELNYKVSRIPRWGKENKDGVLDRFTAKKIFVKKILSNGGSIRTNTKYIDSKIDRNSIWKLKIQNLENKSFYNLKSRNLVLALGASKTPIALSNIGLKHRKLGKFEIHPTARLSAYYPLSNPSKAVVEPFQLTGLLPKIMIGSSATKRCLSKANYPFKKNYENIDFSKVANFYSMAPSKTKGKIILNGILKGIKFYNIDKKTKFQISKGLKIIIDICLKSGAESIYHSGDVLDILKIKNEKYYAFFISQCIKKTLSSVHIMSSASMGNNGKLCPLNSNGSIDGIKNLLVVDQSLLPSCPTVNPQSTACVFSYINTLNFLNEL